MLRASFVFTVFFMLLGPIKVIPAFFKLTHGATPAFKREVAIKAALLASGLWRRSRCSEPGWWRPMPFLSMACGSREVGAAHVGAEDHVSCAEPSNTDASKPTALELAMSPLAVPLIVPPAGIAAILIFVGLAPKSPGIELVIPLALVAMMALNFLVMFFIDQIVRIPGLMLVLQVFGAILVFIQVALAVEILMIAFKGVGALGAA